MQARSFLVEGAASGGTRAGDYRKDEHTAKGGARYRQTKTPRLLVIGPATPTSAPRGHRGLPQGDPRADDMLGELDRTLGRMGDDGAETAVTSRPITTLARRTCSITALSRPSPPAYGLPLRRGHITHQGVTQRRS